MCKNNSEMTVIIVTPDNFKSVRKTVNAFKSQFETERLELVLVGPNGLRREALGENLDVFGRVQVIETDKHQSITKNRATGIMAAASPIVLLTEDHAFPDPKMTSVLLSSIQKNGWDGAGPMMVNANPGSLISWANLILAHGKFVFFEKKGNDSGIPWHNSAYNKQLLLGFGEELDAALENEGLMQKRLFDKGYRFCMNPLARTYHLNISKMDSFISEQFNTGRVYGSTRSDAFSGLMKYVYFFGAPLIPFKRIPCLLRLARKIETANRIRLFPGVLPALILGLCVHTIGEAFGYGFGPGRAKEIAEALECGRFRHLSKNDKKYFVAS